MKKTGFIVLAVLAIGCTREIIPNDTLQPAEKNTLTVKAVTKDTDPADVPSKISYGTTDATWEEGDKIFLIKNDGTTITLTLSDGIGSTSGSFSSSDPVVAGTYIPYAVSATSLASGFVTVSDGAITLDLSTPGGGTLADALKHDILKGNAVTLTDGQDEAAITGLNTHLLSYLRFRFTSGTKAITAVGLSSEGGIKQTVTVAANGTISGSNATTDPVYVTAGDNGADVYSGYIAVYGSTSISLVAYAEDEDGGKYGRLVSMKNAEYTPGKTYGKDFALSSEMVTDATEGTLSSQTWENLGLSVKWAKYNYGSAGEYSYDRNVYNTINAIPDGWSGWRFPTRAEVQELFYVCSRQWVSGTNNGVKFIGPNSNYVPMGAGGRYRVRDDGNDWTYDVESSVYFYLDETTESNGELSRIWATIGSEGQSLSYGSGNHGNYKFWYDDAIALRLVCDY